MFTAGGNSQVQRKEQRVAEVINGAKLKFFKRRQIEHRQQ
jgi:hypothetical protein